MDISTASIASLVEFVMRFLLICSEDLERGMDDGYKFEMGNGNGISCCLMVALQ